MRASYLGVNANFSKGLCLTYSATFVGHKKGAQPQTIAPDSVGKIGATLLPDGYAVNDFKWQFCPQSPLPIMSYLYSADIVWALHLACAVAISLGLKLPFHLISGSAIFPVDSDSFLEKNLYLRQVVGLEKKLENFFNWCFNGVMGENENFLIVLSIDQNISNIEKCLTNEDWTYTLEEISENVTIITYSEKDHLNRKFTFLKARKYEDVINHIFKGDAHRVFQNAFSGKITRRQFLWLLVSSSFIFLTKDKLNYNLSDLGIFLYEGQFKKLVEETGNHHGRLLKIIFRPNCWGRPALECIGLPGNLSRNRISTEDVIGRYKIFNGNKHLMEFFLKETNLVFAGSSIVNQLDHAGVLWFDKVYLEDKDGTLTKEIESKNSSWSLLADFYRNYTKTYTHDDVQRHPYTQRVLDLFLELRIFNNNQNEEVAFSAVAKAFLLKAYGAVFVDELNKINDSISGNLIKSKIYDDICEAWDALLQLGKLLISRRFSEKTMKNSVLENKIRLSLLYYWLGATEWIGYLHSEILFPLKPQNYKPNYRTPDERLSDWVGILQKILTISEILLVDSRNLADQNAANVVRLEAVWALSWVGLVKTSRSLRDTLQNNLLLGKPSRDLALTFQKNCEMALERSRNEDLRLCYGFMLTGKNQGNIGRLEDTDLGAIKRKNEKNRDNSAENCTDKMEKFMKHYQRSIDGLTTLSLSD